MKRIVFMGTPDFAVPCLQKLIETQTVVGVVTQPDRPAGRGQQLHPSPIKVVAEAAGIPVYQPDSLRRPEQTALIREWQPEAIVVAAFGQILRQHLLDLPPLGCLNVHASLLPRWRGAAPIQQAILSGDAETGISLMKMEAGLDTGPVFVQQAIPITAQETAGTLHDKLAVLGAEMLANYLEAILSGRIPPTPQNNDLTTYAPMIQKEQGQINWQQDSQQIDRQIRAMSPWPGTFTYWNGKLLKLLAARPVTKVVADQPGLVAQHQNEWFVQCGAGSLQLLMVQLEGKRPATGSDFGRGRPDFANSYLGATK